MMVQTSLRASQSQNHQLLSQEQNNIYLQYQKKKFCSTDITRYDPLGAFRKISREAVNRALGQEIQRAVVDLGKLQADLM